MNTTITTIMIVVIILSVDAMLPTLPTDRNRNPVSGRESDDNNKTKTKKTRQIIILSYESEYRGESKQNRTRQDPQQRQRHMNINNKNILQNNNIMVLTMEALMAMSYVMTHGSERAVRNVARTSANCQFRAWCQRRAFPQAMKTTE